MRGDERRNEEWREEKKKEGDKASGDEMNERGRSFNRSGTHCTKLKKLEI